MRAILLSIVCVTGCSGAEAGESDAASGPEAPAGTPSADAAAIPPRPTQAASLAARYDFDEPIFRADLPGRLDEISGLAFSPDGRLFAHDDERGRVHELDPRTGAVGKRFDLEGGVRDDLEGIAIVGERFFLISSRGRLYEFREADDRGVTPYHASDTGVGGQCEVEGLEHDPAEDALLVACKVVTPDRGAVVVHRIPMDPTASRLPPLTIARDQLEAHDLGPDFEPSAVAVDPSGTLLLVSARQEALLEVDRAGRVLSALVLSRSRHPQSEGLAIGPDGTLYLSDERNGGDARVSAYAPRPPPP